MEKMLSDSLKWKNKSLFHSSYIITTNNKKTCLELKDRYKFNNKKKVYVSINNDCIMDILWRVKEVVINLIIFLE